VNEGFNFSFIGPNFWCLNGIANHFILIYLNSYQVQVNEIEFNVYSQEMHLIKKAFYTKPDKEGPCHYT
jgi:hypothetical protein